MFYKDLQEGYTIEFRIIKDGSMQYHRTPVYHKMMEVNKRLKELHEDPAVIRAEVYKTKYFDKTL